MVYALLALIMKPFSKLHRKCVSLIVFKRHQGIIQHGPFKGLNLNGKANTSSGNLGAKIFGLYEPEVLAEIESLGPFGEVIDFGAADGYFSLGVLVGNLAERSICFEMSEKGQRAISNNAKLNGVKDKVVINGAVDENVGNTLRELNFKPARGLLVCDIEGAEFSVLTKKLLSDLKGCTLIIELHDRLPPSDLDKREKLINRLPKSARHRIIKSEPAQWSGISEIEAMSDFERALICVDGRKVLGEWLVVTYP